MMNMGGPSTVSSVFFGLVSFNISNSLCAPFEREPARRLGREELSVLLARRYRSLKLATSSLDFSTTAILSPSLSNRLSLR